MKICNTVAFVAGANRGLGLGLVYAPYLRNSDIAVAPEQVWRPDRVWIQYEGRPDAYLIFEVGSAWTKP